MSPSAGPLALARDILDADFSPFFVLNNDVICNYPFTKMLEAHKASSRERRNHCGQFNNLFDQASIQIRSAVF